MIGNDTVNRFDYLGLLEWSYDGNWLWIKKHWYRRIGCKRTELEYWDIYMISPEGARKILRKRGLEDAAMKAVIAMILANEARKLREKQKQKQQEAQQPEEPETPSPGNTTPDEEEPKPPGWNEDWEKRYPEGWDEQSKRPSKRAREGKKRWYDPEGGEWRYNPEDDQHNPHWDHNKNDHPASPWENVPIGDKPPVKPTPTTPTSGT